MVGYVAYSGATVWVGDYWVCAEESETSGVWQWCVR
jgi:hypothetical protein